MIDIIFLAVIAGVLIVRLLMILGEKRDDDPTPPFSLLDATKKKANKSILGAGNPANTMPNAESNAPEPSEAPPVGFFLEEKEKEKNKEEKKSTKSATIIEESSDPRWANAWPGIMAIKAREENFIASDFLNKAEQVFEIILDCFVRGDRPADKTSNRKSTELTKMPGTQLLAEYLAPDLLAVFIDAIKEREKQNYHQENKNLIGIRHSSIVEASADEKTKICQVKVLFESDQIYALYDKDNNLVEGDDSQIIPKKDIWVFEKKSGLSNDGRWWLMAIEE